MATCTCIKGNEFFSDRTEGCEVHDPEVHAPARRPSDLALTSQAELNRLRDVEAQLAEARALLDEARELVFSFVDQMYGSTWVVSFEELLAKLDAEKDRRK